MRRAGILAWAAAVALVLSACGGLSMDSPVQPGLEVGAAQDNPVRVLPAGPAAGSSPEQIVRGFLIAGAASDDEYQIARSFMTASPEGTWRPDSSIMVFSDESALSFRQVDETTVQATARVVASIDSGGHYRILPAGTVAESTFRLENSAGEWRIDALEESFGLWLRNADLTRLYAPYRIHYVSTSGRKLVPDVRWFPTGKGLATRLARAQLAEVPAYLKGAVRSDIPAGTRLTVDAVPIDSGLATVDLTATRPGGDPIRRQNLWAQFVATLTQVPEVRRISLTVEGTPLELPGVDSPPGSLSDLDFPVGPSASAGVKPVIRNGASLRRIDPQQVGKGAEPDTVEQKEGLPTVAPGWVWLAMSRAGTEIAAVGGDRAELSRWRGAGQIRVPFFGTRLTRPTYDQQDVLWVAGQDNGARVWAINAAGDPNDTQRTAPRRVEAGWLAGRVVVALRVAPGGQRVAVITTDPGGRDPRVDVAGVIRESNGTPSGLASPMRVAGTLTLARDLVWVDDTRLAVLGRISAEGAVLPWIAEVGGAMSAVPSDVKGAESITTTNGERGLVLTTDRDEILVRAGSSWLPLAEGTDFMAPAT